MAETAVGPTDAHIIPNLNLLAELYPAERRHAAAEPLLQRSLAIQEATLGAQDPKISFPVAALARLYRGWGRLEQAEPSTAGSSRSSTVCSVPRTFTPPSPSRGSPVSTLRRESTRRRSRCTAVPSRSSNACSVGPRRRRQPAGGLRARAREHGAQ